MMPLILPASIFLCLPGLLAQQTAATTWVVQFLFSPCIYVYAVNKKFKLGIYYTTSSLLNFIGFCKTEKSTFSYWVGKENRHLTVEKESKSAKNCQENNLGINSRTMVDVGRNIVFADKATRLPGL